jgi:hypothetical protein
LGYKKIQAKRQEFAAKQAVMFKFRDAVREINLRSAKVAEAIKKLETAKDEIAASISSLHTGGVPQFEAYKKSLLGMTANVGTLRALPLDPVEKVVNGAEDELRAMVRAYEDKLAAACPKDIKPGMVFKRASDGTLFEVQSASRKATNPSLRGDDAIWFDGVYITDGKPSGSTAANLTTLKKMKYLKTD